LFPEIDDQRARHGVSRPTSSVPHSAGRPNHRPVLGDAGVLRRDAPSRTESPTGGAAGAVGMVCTGCCPHPIAGADRRPTRRYVRFRRVAASGGRSPPRAARSGSSRRRSDRGRSPTRLPRYLRNPCRAAVHIRVCNRATSRDGPAIASLAGNRAHGAHRINGGRQQSSVGPTRRHRSARRPQRGGQYGSPQAPRSSRASSRLV
jgi:hypothetical protein